VYPPADYWSRRYSEAANGTPKLQFSSTAYITNETASWLPDFIAGTAIIQPINADIQANAMPASIGGGATDVSGPMLTSNIAFDQILETLSLAYGPLGQQPSR
jgi:hypothetical protein